jgi:hypothetical protein
MAKGKLLIGRASGSPTPAKAEDAAQEYFINRAFAGNYAARPNVSRWRADQRERFEKELERLEAQNRSDREAASLDAQRRTEAESRFGRGDAA